MQQNVSLHPKYYLDNFNYLLSFVSNQYGAILTKEEIGFAESFNSLEEDEKCLYVRLVCRKPVYFRFSRLSYPEIGDLNMAAEGLVHKGFLSLFADGPMEGFSILDCFTKNEIASAYIAAFPGSRISKSASKEAFMEWIAYNPMPFFEELLKSETIISPSKLELLELYGFLFFGNLHFDMTRFVVRDLGRVRYEEVGEDAFRALFKSRAELEACYAIYRHNYYYNDLLWQYPGDIQYKWFLEEIGPIPRNHSKTERAFNKLVHKIGKCLERESMFEEALEIYAFTVEYPSRERMVRILEKKGEKTGAIDLARLILSYPVNTTERIFAEDFLAKIERKKIVKSTTKKLNTEIQLIHVEEIKGKVEECIIDHYSAIGYSAFFSENYPFKALFGLLFWDVVFDANALSSPFQVVPEALRSGNFFQEKRIQVEALLKSYESRDYFHKVLVKNHKLKFGTANPFVFWSDSLLDQLITLTNKLSHQALMEILREICKNPHENSKGFPDLFVFNEAECFFAEVKSENDQLSNKQLHWVNFFQVLGITVKIVRPIITARI